MTCRARVFLGFLLACGAMAQQFVISTVAGGAPPPGSQAATATSIGSPYSVAVDSGGNRYFSAGECVFKVDSAGILSVVAGNSRRGYSGDGGLAVNAQLHEPYGVALDGNGNLYIADELNNRIRRVSPAGVITTVAGSGIAGFSGDGGPATQAQLHDPLNVAVDSAGNLYIADLFNYRIRKVSPEGLITTVGGGGAADPGDGGLATNAVIAGPDGMALDAAGNLYVADSSRNRVRKIAPDGTISTVAGNGTTGFSGDGGSATSAELSLPADVATDSAGNLYIADTGNNRIRLISPGGTISTLATGSALSAPSGVKRDSSGNLYIADRFHNRLQMVSASGTVSTLAGNGLARLSGDGGPALMAQMNGISGVTVDRNGNLFLCDWMNGRIREVSTDGIISTVAGGGSASPGDGGQATSARLVSPLSIGIDAAGNLYIGDQGDNRVRKVSTTGIITTIAGNGTAGFSGDGGTASSAQLSNITGVAADGAGDVFISDYGNHRVREVTPDGIITTIAGGGTSTADGVLATSAQLNPRGLTVDSAGTLYVVDVELRPLIRAVSSGGLISTFAQGIADPEALAIDGSGNLYVADCRENKVVKVGLTGVAVSIAGTGLPGYSGDGGPALTAQLDLGSGTDQAGIAVDSGGTVYVADVVNYSVRMLRAVAQSAVIGAVVDAASESVTAVSPGKILTIYGDGLGPAQPVFNRPVNGLFATSAGGSSVYFNGIAAPILYGSATQIIAVAPYEITGDTVQVVVGYQGLSASITLPVAASAPSLFTSNQTGAGEAAAINDLDGTLNSAANPAKIGDYVSLYATGEGQTGPGGVDGRTGGTPPALPIAKVGVTVGGVPTFVQYSGGVYGDVSGLMQVNVQIPAGVQAGGYVPVVLQVGDATSNLGTWIAVAGK